MPVVVFDVDGTLTLGRGVGTHCFFESFVDLFGMPDPSRALGDFVRSTDSGIAVEILGPWLGRPPTAEELDSVQERYLLRLRQALVDETDAYRSVPGAQAMLARLYTEAAWNVRLGTGNWKRAAMLKLEQAGLAINGTQEGAFADDALTRVGIVRCALERASADFQDAVFVGDRIWDVEAARELELRFVGVGRGASAVALADAGASHVVQDYTDQRAFLEALGAASVPS